MYRITRPFLFLIVLVFLYVHQTQAALAGRNLFPDLLTILVIFCGLYFGIRTGAETGFLAGFMRDILGTGTFGFYTVTLALCGIICGALSDKVYRDNMIVEFLIVFCVVLGLSRVFVMHAFLSALAAPVIFLPLRELVRVREHA